MNMAGFPESQLINWTKKFMEAGKKVAVAGEASTALAKSMAVKKGTAKKGIVERKLNKVCNTCASSVALVTHFTLGTPLAFRARRQS